MAKRKIDAAPPIVGALAVIRGVAELANVIVRDLMAVKGCQEHFTSANSPDRDNPDQRAKVLYCPVAELGVSCDLLERCVRLRRFQGIVNAFSGKYEDHALLEYIRSRIRKTVAKHALVGQDVYGTLDSFAVADMVLGMEKRLDENGTIAATALRAFDDIFGQRKG